MELNTPPPVPAEHPLCRTWGQGCTHHSQDVSHERSRPRDRIHSPRSVLSWDALWHSYVFPTGAASTQTSRSSDRDIRARLVAQDIPESIIGEVIAGKPVANAELTSLNSQQQSAIHDAQLSASAQKVGAGAATVIAGGFSLFVIVASFLGGLLGWLLVMRKRVLQCARCGAVVPAS